MYIFFWGHKNEWSNSKNFHGGQFAQMRKKDTVYSDRPLLFTSGRCRQRRVPNAWSGPSEATCSEGAVGEKKLQEGGGCWTRWLQGSWLMTHRPGECLWATVLQSSSPGAWLPNAGQKEGRRQGWPRAEDALPLQKLSLIFKQYKRQKYF